MDTREQVARLEAELRGGGCHVCVRGDELFIGEDWDCEPATPHDTPEGRWEWVRLLRIAVIPDMVTPTVTARINHLRIAATNVSPEPAVTVVVEMAAKQRSERDASK